MYIGPWQEYRLAKIQDDAIQRLRREWEAQLRGQLPTGDDDRIRELMQPLMAKLPSLLAPKSRASGSSMGSRTGSSSIGSRNGSRSGLNSEVGSQYSSRPPSARSTTSSASARSRTNSLRSIASYSRARESGDITHRHTRPRGENNQDNHDANSARVAPKPPKPKKKGKKAPLTSLEQVQKRKKMFATWIKQAGNGNNDVPEQAAQEVNAETRVDETSIVTKLPPIHSAAPVNATMLLEDTKPKISSPLTLPPLHKLSVLTEESPNTLVAHQAAEISPRVPTISNAADIDLDESVDEEEINNLLNWTDTLLSPRAMDSLCDFDD